MVLPFERVEVPAEDYNCKKIINLNHAHNNCDIIVKPTTSYHLAELNVDRFSVCSFGLTLLHTYMYCHYLYNFQYRDVKTYLITSDNVEEEDKGTLKYRIE